MIRLFILLLVIAAGLAAGPLLEGRQGYILIAFEQYTIEMSVVSGVTALVVVYILVTLCSSLIKRIFKGGPQLHLWWRGRRNRSARSQTQQGLLSLYQGDYQDAQQKLTKSAKGSDSPTLNYLSAAKAAAHQGEFKQSDQLLDKADKQSGDPQTRYAVKLTRARLKLQSGDYAAVKELLEALPKDQHQRPAVQQLHFEIARHEGNWDRQLELLKPLLKRQPERWQSEQQRVYHGKLNALAKTDTEAFRRYWKSIPKSLKQQSWLLSAAADALQKAEHSDDLQYWLKKALKHPDDELFSLLHRLPAEQLHKILPQLEALDQRADKHPQLLPLLAKIQIHEGKLDLAEKYLQQSLEQKPTAMAYQLMGDLFAARRDSAQAMHYYRLALQLRA